MRFIHLTSKIFIQILSAFLISSFLLWMHDKVQNHQLQHHRPINYCKVTNVQQNPLQSCHHQQGFTPSSAILYPCFWHVQVQHPSINTSTHLFIDKNHTTLSTNQLHLLKSLNGCKSLSTCKNTSLQCTYGVEDPSDILWLRTYNEDAAFIAMCRICVVTFMFFLAAIISEQSLFTLRNAGLFNETIAFYLVLIGLSSLLYIIVIPDQYQFAIWGDGPVQSFAFCFTIILVAASLPGIVIVSFEITKYLIDIVTYTFVFFFFVFSWLLTFLLIKFIHTIESTFAILKHIYVADENELTDSNDYTNRIAEFNGRFLERVIDSSSLRQIRKFTVDNALRICVKNVEDHLSDDDATSVLQLLPGAEYGSIEDEDSPITNERDDDSQPREDSHLLP